MERARARRRTGLAAIVLLLGAALAGGLYRVADAAEHHAYNSGALPAASYQLTEGRTYQISTPGGLADLTRRHVDVAAPACTWSTGTAASQHLRVTALGSDAKANHVVATFVAPAGGPVRIACAGWGPVMVDDADSATWDVAGLLLVVTVILLTAGTAVGLGALYRHSTQRQPGGASAWQPSNRAARR